MEEKVEQTKPNRLRRAFFVFGGALLFSSMAFYSLLFTTGSITEIFIKGCLGIVEIIVIMYLGTTTVDRSGILSKIGNSMRAKVDTNNNRNYASRETPDRDRNLVARNYADNDGRDASDIARG